MKWFWKSKSGINTPEKKNTTEGLWIKCDTCKETLYSEDVKNNYQVCPTCHHHFMMSPQEYIDLLIDPNTFEETLKDLFSKDPLQFVDKKKYKDRLQTYIEKTGYKSAVVSGTGKIKDLLVSIGIMNFRFGGGSMGTTEGEKLASVFKVALEKKCPAIIIAKSGGARMQEGTLSLMQMAKTAGYIAQIKEAKLPYICILTHPTTGGVTASFAMLGDIHISEPKALIGFAGRRVVETTIGEKLPDDFQTAEFLEKKGFIDMISHRKELRDNIALFLSHLTNQK